MLHLVGRPDSQNWEVPHELILAYFNKDLSPGKFFWKNKKIALPSIDCSPCLVP